jgi:UDP-2,3-diacylglucosamine pyrophosphatase LpxH
MHDQVLEALQSEANVRLVSALRDPRMGFPGENDIRIFIPDLHLLSNARQSDFSYSTNHPEMLAGILDSLVSLRTALKREGKVFVVYQLGDYLDLWREEPTGMEDPKTADRIVRSNRKVAGALTRLGFRLLLGNHDFDLYRTFPAWERRYFLTGPNQPKPEGVVLHGDIFDIVERLPDQLSRWAVYVFGPYHTATDYDLGEMKEIVRKAHRGRNYKHYIGEEGTVDVLATDGAIPPEWNVRREGNAGAELGFLDTAFTMCDQINRAQDQHLHLVVCGHTHAAKIAVREINANEIFTIMDCGAWIENCINVSDGSKVPNAQIGVLCNNDARIYQLAPKSES